MPAVPPLLRQRKFGRLSARWLAAGTAALTLHQRLSEFQNHVLHVTVLMPPFGGSLGILLKAWMSDEFPELVTALLILLFPRGSALAKREALCGAQRDPRSPLPSAGQGCSATKDAPPTGSSCGTQQSWLCCFCFSFFFFFVWLVFFNFRFTLTDFYPLWRTQFGKEAVLQFNNEWPRFLCSSAEKQQLRGSAAMQVWHTAPAAFCPHWPDSA